MGLLKNLISGMGEDKKITKAKFKDEQQNRKIQKILDEREKSANRRELEKYYQEQEEERIKVAVDKIRKERTKESWCPTKTILTSDCNILANDRPILKEKNIFKDNKHIFMNNKSTILDGRLK